MVHGGLKTLVNGEIPAPRDLDRELELRKHGAGVGDNIVTERPGTVGQLGRDTTNGLVGCGDTATGIRVGEASTGPGDEQGGACGNAPLAAQLPATNARQLGRGAGKPLGTGLPHQGRLSAVESPRTSALTAKLVFSFGVFDPRTDHGAEVGFFGGVEVCWRTL
ncbi:hypothetical protein [Dietzia maris]|uniref:hypothetical protein n=1 Tax=Dietzia maris TaxID=37915 RepID=UPI002330B28B|nr:hypothetical protein [Dietzia maris]